MKRSTWGLWPWFLAAAACSGGSGHATPSPAALQAYCGDDFRAVEQRIDGILSRLSLDEKTLQTRGEFPGEMPWEVLGIPEENVPPWFMTDGPRGVSKMVGKATAFPVAAGRGATFDPELEARVGEAIGVETRAVGRNNLLAPTMNILRHPRWGRAQETYGEDPHHMAEMALAFVNGAQRQVPVTAKHYAVNSIEDTRMQVDVQIDERTLRELYLPHFERVVREGHVAAIMTAYNSVNGAYCSENPELVRDILKGEWEFAGVVMSDWGGTVANASTTSEEHTVAAALAGLDIEMFVQRIFGGPLYSAVYEGQLDEAVVDDMVRRSLRARLCHRLDTNPPVVDPTAMETAATRSLAREVAERSFVLLRNEASALPIDRAPGANVVVTGPLADFENLGDLGSSSVSSTNVTTVYEGLLAAAGAANVTLLDHAPANAQDLALLSNADVVVMVAGLTSAEEGEGQIAAGDRTSLALPSAQLQWISDVAAASNRVVLVLEAGSALDLDTVAPTVEAMVMAWYPGLDGGTALANVLYGDVNFSGRLPVAFPVDEADLPAFDRSSPVVTYDYFHGYRKLDADGVAPLYPFGYGLSYTTFSYGNLRLDRTSGTAKDTVQVSVDVTNTGSRPGRETVQLYVGPVATTVAPRFVRELEAFGQTLIPAGQTRTVTLSLPLSRLAYWNTERHRFEVERTAYRVEVGSSSRDLPLSATLQVTR